VLGLRKAKPQYSWRLRSDIGSAWLRSNYFALKLYLWWVNSPLIGTWVNSPWTQHPTVPILVEHNTPESLVSLSWPWGPPPTSCSCILLLWCVARYFSEKSVISPFTWLHLKCLFIQHGVTSVIAPLALLDHELHWILAWLVTVLAWPEQCRAHGRCLIIVWVFFSLNQIKLAITFSTSRKGKEWKTYSSPVRA
jgi:hypothetical protein